MNKTKFAIGDIIDIKQTVNGYNKFVIGNNEVRYLNPDGSVGRKYEYDVNELLEGTEVEIVGHMNVSLITGTPKLTLEALGDLRGYTTAKLLEIYKTIPLHARRARDEHRKHEALKYFKELVSEDGASETTVITFRNSLTSSYYGGTNPIKRVRITHVNDGEFPYVTTIPHNRVGRKYTSPETLENIIGGEPEDLKLSLAIALELEKREEIKRIEEKYSKLTRVLTEEI